MANKYLPDFTFQPYYEKYAPLPLDEYEKTSNYLQKEYETNKGNLDKTELALKNDVVLSNDAEAKTIAQSRLNDFLTGIAKQGNNFEFQGNNVRKAYMDYAGNEYLNTAKLNKAEVDKHLKKLQEAGETDKILAGFTEVSKFKTFDEKTNSLNRFSGEIKQKLDWDKKQNEALNAVKADSVEVGADSGLDFSRVATDGILSQGSYLKGRKAIDDAKMGNLIYGLTKNKDGVYEIDPTKDGRLTSDYLQSTEGQNQIEFLTRGNTLNNFKPLSAEEAKAQIKNELWNGAAKELFQETKNITKTNYTNASEFQLKKAEKPEIGQGRIGNMPTFNKNSTIEDVEADTKNAKQVTTRDGNVQSTIGSVLRTKYPNETEEQIQARISGMSSKDLMSELKNVPSGVNKENAIFAIKQLSIQEKNNNTLIEAVNNKFEASLNLKEKVEYLKYKENIKLQNKEMYEFESEMKKRNPNYKLDVVTENLIKSKYTTSDYDSKFEAFNKEKAGEILTTNNSSYTNYGKTPEERTIIDKWESDAKTNLSKGLVNTTGFLNANGQLLETNVGNLFAKARPSDIVTGFDVINGKFVMSANYNNQTVYIPLGKSGLASPPGAERFLEEIEVQSALKNSNARALNGINQYSAYIQTNQSFKDAQGRVSLIPANTEVTFTNEGRSTFINYEINGTQIQKEIR